jgi:succinate dehydrogenase / fumarate reductase cytochrome b subunit
MAVTGQLMLLFVIAHVVGNSTIYFSNLNAYAAALHALPLLLWSYRFFMAVVIALHVFFAIVLTLENRKAKPGSYAVSSHISATFAGRNMIWTGAITGAFLVYHLLHFTAQVISPETAAISHPDALGRPDVFMMVVHGFQRSEMAGFYIISMAALLLHLTHGIQSSFQTWGLNSDRSFPIVRKTGAAAAIILFLGYAAIPIVIIAGILKG